MNEPLLQIDLPGFDETQKSFADESRGLESVPQPFFAHLRGGQSMENGVHQRHEGIQCVGIAFMPRSQKRGNLSAGRHDDLR